MSTAEYISDKAASERYGRKPATLQGLARRGVLQAWTVDEHLQVKKKQKAYEKTYYKIADLERLIEQRRHVQPKAPGDYPEWLANRIEEIGNLLQQAHGHVTRTDIIKCLNADPIHGYKTPYYLAWEPNRAHLSHLRGGQEEQPGITRILIKSSPDGKLIPTALNEEELHVWIQHAKFVLDQLVRTMAFSIDNEEIQRLGAAAGMQIETSTILTVRRKAGTKYNQPRVWPVVKKIADAHPEWLRDPKALRWRKEA